MSGHLAPSQSSVPQGNSRQRRRYRSQPRTQTRDSLSSLMHRKVQQQGRSNSIRNNSSQRTRCTSSSRLNILRDRIQHELCLKSKAKCSALEQVEQQEQLHSRQVVERTPSYSWRSCPSRSPWKMTQKEVSRTKFLTSKAWSNRSGTLSSSFADLSLPCALVTRRSTDSPAKHSLNSQTSGWCRVARDIKS